jgi:hypothetical protein
VVFVGGRNPEGSLRLRETAESDKSIPTLLVTRN